MKKSQVLTYASLLILPFTIYQSIIGYHIVASTFSFLALLLAYVDNNLVTGRIQQIAVFCSALTIGFIFSKTSLFPFFSIVIVVSAIGVTIRLTLIKIFSYSKYRFFELFLFLLNIPLVTLGLLQDITNWYYFIPAYIFLIFQFTHSINTINNAKQLSKGVEKGYNASIGVKAPDFYLPDQNGNNVSLSEFKGKRNILLIFVRGDWCPYCHMIMRTYMRNNHKFMEKNIMLIAIGPDPVGINREMALKLGLEYKILYDDKMKIAQEYGIRLPDYKLPGATFHEEGMPLPASFLIDKNGIVQYTSRSSKVGEFLAPDLIFPIVESLK